MVVSTCLFSCLLMAGAGASHESGGAQVSPPEPGAADVSAETGSAADTSEVVRQEKGGIVIWHRSAARDGSLLVVELDARRGQCATPYVEWMRSWFEPIELGPRWQVLLPVKLGEPEGDKLLSVHCGRDVNGYAIRVYTGVYPETELRVARRFSREPPARVVAEADRITEALQTRTRGRLWSEPFVRPASGRTTSTFGVRRVFNRFLHSQHRGTDIDGRTGTPLYASNAGIVVLAARGYYFTGNAVFIDHGDQLFTMYFHLSRIRVSTGQRVRRGQRIGAIGKTGRVTGPHVHFGVKLAGIYIDPQEMLAFEPGLSLVDSEASVEENVEDSGGVEDVAGVDAAR